MSSIKKPVSQFKLSRFERWVLSIVGTAGLIAENEDGSYDFADYSWEFGAHKPLNKALVNRLYNNGYLRKADFGDGLVYNRFQGTEQTATLFNNYK